MARQDRRDPAATDLSQFTALHGPEKGPARERPRPQTPNARKSSYYCDTAPAYAGSLDYYGAALGRRRQQVFLASKSHERTRDGSLRLLDDSLRRLRTDHLDLWQLHDLRTSQDLDHIFAKGGAIEALVRAREEGRVRFLGVTGHHHPAILMEAMRRFDFDTVLVALNAADIHRLSF